MGVLFEVVIGFSPGRRGAKATVERKGYRYLVLLVKP
jgi:hypothetical protein